MSYYKTKEELAKIKKKAEHVYLLFIGNKIEEYTGFEIVNDFAETLTSPEGVSRKFKAEGKNIYKYSSNKRKELFQTFETEEKALLASFDLNTPMDKVLSDLVEERGFYLFNDISDAFSGIQDYFEDSPEYYVDLTKALTEYLKNY